MSEIRNIIAVCMKYMFYFILAMIVFAFIVSAFEYAGIKFIHIKSDDVYYIAALIVCISPFMWAFLFILFQKQFMVPSTFPADSLRPGLLQFVASFLM